MHSRWIMRSRFAVASPSAKSTLFPLTRQSLLVRLYDLRDNDAWRQFLDIYDAVIYRMGRGGGLSESDAEGVVGTVMGNVAQSFRSGHTVKGRLRNYLRTIANREIHKQMQSNGKALHLGPADVDVADEADLNQEWSQIEDQECLRVCMERLRSSPAIRPRDFAAFVSLVIHEEPVKVVAKRFGITSNRLYGIKHKLIGELRKAKLRLDVELGEV